jgi:hypothetical protein
MKPRWILACLLLGALLAPQPARALVKLDDGRRLVLGVQLLQDHADPNAYYYVPTYPRLAENQDGTLSLLCMKYVDPKGKTGGGLFHALVELSLPPKFVADLEKELKKQVPQGRIVGPVPLLPDQSQEGQGEGRGSFEVVSAVLKNGGDGGFTRTLIASGKAPLTPGSRAAVAALLNSQGATLLWDSLGQPTSDVSVSVNAYYEAMVTGFDARITADVRTVYTHFSSLYNRQHDYTKTQVRNVVDELQRKGDIKVEVLDRSKGLDLKAADMQALVDTITNKIVELMFDSKTGFSADPPREVAVEQGQIAGRRERGFFSKLFGGAPDEKYYTDDQFVLKDRKDIRQNTFSVILTKNSTVKVPVNTSGNLRGLYSDLKNDQRYFRIVNLGDPAFEFRSVFFQVDGEYAGSFQDAINFVAVNIRKKQPNGNPDYTSALRFSQEVMKDGKLAQEISYPRLGDQSLSWLEYEYQVVWSVHNRKSVTVPPGGDRWLSTSDPVVSLTPPFEKVGVEVDADRGRFQDMGVASANVVFEYPLLGEPKRTRVTLRAADTSSISQLALYRDPGSKLKARVTWYFKNGKTAVRDIAQADDTYFLLVPPEDVK